MMSSGINLVMTVIGFAVSTMFIVFVCTRLICARIQLRNSRRSFPLGSRSNFSIVMLSLSLYICVSLLLYQLPFLVHIRFEVKYFFVLMKLPISKSSIPFYMLRAVWYPSVLLFLLLQSLPTFLLFLSLFEMPIYLFKHVLLFWFYNYLYLGSRILSNLFALHESWKCLLVIVYGYIDMHVLYQDS